jgi:hypothetical protein
MTSFWREERLKGKECSGTVSTSFDFMPFYVINTNHATDIIALLGCETILFLSS